MARLWSSGAELNTTTANVELKSHEGSNSTTTIKTGTYAFRVNRAVSGTSSGSFDFKAVNTADGFYFRSYFRYATVASTTIPVLMTSRSGPIQMVSIRMTSGGALQLFNHEDNVQVGSDSAALNANTWYRLEFKVDCTTIASTAVDARIDGVSFASGTIDLANSINGLFIGNGLTNATFDFFFDDIAINDDSGSFQNSWPGAGEIRHLKPSAAGDASDWTNDYTNVDEVTPDDVTTLVSSNTLNQEDLHNIEDTPVGIGSGDTINVVAVGVRFNGAGASDNATFKLEIEASASGTIEQSGDITPSNTTWVTNAAAAPRNYQALTTLYDLPGASTTAWTKADLDAAQIGYKLTATSTNAAQVSTVWLLVDSTPAIERTTLTSGTDTTDDTDSVTASITPAADALLLLTIVARADADQPTISSISGNGLTWVEVDHVDFDASGSRRSLFLYRAMGASPSAGAITITFIGTQTSKAWVVDQITGVATTGSNGEDAIVQSASNSGSSVTSLTATLAAFASANNVTYGSFGNAGEGNLTAGTNFTLAVNQQVSGEAGAATEFQNGNDTTVDMSGPTMDIGGIALELTAEEAGGATAVKDIIGSGILAFAR